MKKVSQIQSVSIIEKFLAKIELSARQSKAETIIEYFELEIDDLQYERCHCAYMQTEDQTEAILFETLLGRYFYIFTEKIHLNTAEKAIPHLFVLDSAVSRIIPKRLKDKMQQVATSRITETVQVDDFTTKFKLYKPK